MATKLHNRQCTNSRQHFFSRSGADASRERDEVRGTTRSAVARSKVRNGNKRVRKLRQRLAPFALQRSIRYRVEHISHFSAGAQVVDVPVPVAVTAQMTAHTRLQPACSACTTHIEIITGWQMILPQPTDIDRLSVRDRQMQGIGAARNRQILKIDHGCFAR